MVAGIIGFAVWIGYPVASKYLHMNDKEVTPKAPDQSQMTLAQKLNAIPIWLVLLQSNMLICKILKNVTLSYRLK